MDREASKGNTKQYYFGFWCWHPQWMQVAFANAKFFTFLLCINGLVEGALVSGEPCSADRIDCSSSSPSPFQSTATDELLPSIVEFTSNMPSTRRKRMVCAWHTALHCIEAGSNAQTIRFQRVCSKSSEINSNARWIVWHSHAPSGKKAKGLHSTSSSTRIWC